jgi:hypothetical protein
MTFSCALLVCLLNTGFVENDSSHIKRIAAIEFSIGQELRVNPSFSLDDFRTLYPQSTLLKNFPQPDQTKVL